jgi:DnaK suppressor protein
MAVLKNITDKIFLRKQKKLLNREYKRLKEQYELTRKFPEYGTSEDENILEVEAFQERLGLQKNIKNLMKDYKEALVKIEKGNYGTCENCKGMIEKERLRVYQAAALCVTCASKVLKKHRR